MPKVAAEINEINKFFVTWISEVAVANALNFYDINRISEGTSAKLLNLLFGYELKDLNKLKTNYPGIDLGDKSEGISFQVTSQSSAAKIIHSLKIFTANNHADEFQKGIKFLIIGNGKRPAVKANLLEPYREIFDFKTGFYLPGDLINLIEELYYTHPEKFALIRNFLKQEFDPAVAKTTIIPFKDAAAKIDFYKRLLIANHERVAQRFVPISCKAGNIDLSFEQLAGQTFVEKGVVIAGPSGCGKSVLARKLAVDFLRQGLPVLLEAKYYEGSLNALFEKEILAFGFSSGVEYFEICVAYQLKSLVLIDGLNECPAVYRPKLLLELEVLIRNYSVIAMITTQVPSDELASLGLACVTVGYPEENIKRAIAASYNGSKLSTKLDPVLKMVSSSMEAKMIGEIGTDDIDRVSRFTLFEIFIRGKLTAYPSEGFLLLAAIAKVLSEKITFSVTERNVTDLMRSNGLTGEVYRECLSAGLIEMRLGQVSFGHEMFLNFFVADSIVRFSKNAAELLAAFDAPKNRDKRLLIIGSIDDSVLLDQVLRNLTDLELLTSLYAGDGGNYCQLWVKNQVKEILGKIEAEIQTLAFEFGDATLTGIQFRQDSLHQWTAAESAIIHTLPCILVQDHYISEVFELIGVMDEVCHGASKAFFAEAREKGFSASTAIFSTTYIGAGIRNAAVTKIMSDLQSGFATFHNAATVSEQSIKDTIKNRSLKHGQFYFLLSLVRYNDKLRLLYPYVLGVLKNWRGYPYHLTQEILEQVAHTYVSEAQRLELISALNKIHSETQNVWLSTSLFDALGALGALEDDAAEYRASVADEVRLVLAQPDSKESWDRAAGIYYAQFDHPYDSAYQSVVQDLPETEKTQFLTLALQGYYSPIFTTSLIRDCWSQLGEVVAPLLVRWTEVPMINPSFPQDSITVFLTAYVLLGKTNYPLQSRFKNEANDKDKSLFAAAEIFYWLNRADLPYATQLEQAKPASDALFAASNPYVIETIWKLHHQFSQSGLHRVFDSGSIKIIEQAYPERVTAACRAELSLIGFQKNIENFPRGEDEIVLHTIWLLEQSGTVMDIDLLRPLSEHVFYGESAVKAILALQSK
jgi:hypothetical protein